MSQNQKLLEALQKGPVRPLMALHDLGIYRLSARIKELREAGYNIMTNHIKVYGRDGKPTRIAEYVLHA